MEKPRTFDDVLKEIREILNSMAHAPEDLEAFANEAEQWVKDFRGSANLWRKVGTERFKGVDWTPPEIPGPIIAPSQLCGSFTVQPWKWK